MSNQCRSCGRDINNNYLPYANAYPTSNTANSDRQSAGSVGGLTKTSSTTKSSSTSKSSSIQSKNDRNCMTSQQHSPTSLSQSNSNKTTTATATAAQVTAKVMFGTVGAIRELRDKEKSRESTTKARRN